MTRRPVTYINGDREYSAEEVEQLFKETMEAEEGLVAIHDRNGAEQTIPTWEFWLMMKPGYYKDRLRRFTRETFAVVQTNFKGDILCKKPIPRPRLRQRRSTGQCRPVTGANSGSRSTS